MVTVSTPGLATSYMMPATGKKDCRYSPTNVWDGDTHTAWVPAAGTDGIGESLIVPWPSGRRAKIWAGYGKSPELFRANNRPKLIRVYQLEMEGVANDNSFIVRNSTETTLRDFNGFQPLPLPPFFDGGDDVPGYGFAIEILSVYPGTKYHDTPISEVRFDPGE